MNYIIYLLEFENGTLYIGQTINIKRRVSQHRIKFGKSFTHTAIDECEADQVILFECMWLQLFRSWGFTVINYKPWIKVNAKQKLQGGSKRKKRVALHNNHLITGSHTLCIDMEYIMR